jgi:hypothetical protein
MFHCIYPKYYLSNLTLEFMFNEKKKPYLIMNLNPKMYIIVLIKKKDRCMNAWEKLYKIIV